MLWTYSNWVALCAKKTDSLLPTLLWLFLLVLPLAGCTTPPSSTTDSTKISRVVSLIPSATELIFAVGQERKLVGVTLNDKYPPSVTHLPKVGDQSIDFEKLVALKPDLVVLDTNFNRDRKKLEELGLRVFELQCDRLSEIAPSMRALASALGDPQAGERAASEFERKLALVKPIENSQRVFVEIWGEPLMTAGSDTLLNDILETLKLENCYRDQKGYFQVDPEDLVNRRPEVVLLPIGETNARPPAGALKLAKRVDWEPQVVEIESDLLVRAGPRVLEGMEHLRQAVSRSGS